MGMWVLCFVAWLLKRAWEVLSGESRVMWGGAQRGTTAACFPYYYSAAPHQCGLALSPSSGAQLFQH